MKAEPIRVAIGAGPSMAEDLSRSVRADPGLDLVALAGDGHATLQAVGAMRPRVLLLDLMIPRLDGVGVLERLQRREVLRPSGIIALADAQNEAALRQAMALGADYCIVWPVAPAVLSARIRMFALPAKTPPRREVPDGPDSLPAELRKQVAMLLGQIGVRPNLLGYRYLADAVALVSQRNELLRLITKELYPTLARWHQTTPTGVERAIRHAVEGAWQAQNSGRKPANSELIALLAERVQLEAEATADDDTAAS